tara:strand:- start:38 stop:274 length:237 start_codon:yes stop_codon:yes gene_type:complete
METLQILGWIYLGIMLGGIGGFLALGLFVGPKVNDYQREIDDLNFKNKILRGENKRLSHRGKPQPRKKRTWKRKPTKK